jgi:hypothetical protein
LSRAWLVVFAKAPRPGLVKTRLSPPLTLDQSAALYEQMLLDVLAVSARWAAEFDLEAVLAFHPPDAVSELVRLAPPDFRVQAQKGPGLAERMANAFAEGAAAGARWVLLRGSDSPGLGLAQFAEAVRTLEAGADLVLTPDNGGGYAMIGMHGACPALFEVPMSTDQVLPSTLAAAERSGLKTVVTSPTFDLDTAADLQSLARLSDEESSDLCPRTVEAIEVYRSNRVL